MYESGTSRHAMTKFFSITVLLILLMSFTAVPIFSAQALDPDINNDGEVNYGDMAIVGTCFGVDLAANPQCVCADTDGSGAVDFTDYSFIAGSFGQRGFPVGPDACVVSQANTAPIANAGPDQTVLVGDTVTLDGSGSSDTDGDTLTFSWTIVSEPAGSAATLSDPTAVMPTFFANVPGIYVVQLIVNDGTVNSAPDTVSITTGNSPPVANAGPDQTVLVNDTVQLDGSASSDVDGDSLTFAWIFTSVPAGSAATLSDPTAVMPTFDVDLSGTYVAQLIVNDGTVNSAPDTVTITTGNSPPVANAGPDQTVLVGDTVQLDGSGSSDADNDPLTFAWSLTSVPPGSTAALSSSTAVNPTFIADVPGEYVAQLIVNDGTVDSAPDTVMITTGNSPPVAEAGLNQSVVAGDTVQLDGSGSSDVDNDPLTFAWSLTSVPLGSTASLSNATLVNPTFVADLPGTYVAQLIVNDGTVDSAPDTVTITATAQSADLSITKTDDVDPILGGNALTYTLTINNAGPSDAQNVVVTDTLPPGVTLVSTTGCTEDPNGVPTCSLGTIAAGGSAAYTITVTVDAGTTGTLTNTATVASDTTDPDTANNTATEDTVVTGATALTCGALLSGSIDQAGETDFFTFNGTAGDVVDLTLVHPGGLFTGGQRARATVFAPSGTQIDQFDSNTQQTLTLPESGTYVVRVNANGLTGVGAYTLGLECRQPLPIPVVDGTVACGGLLQGSIDVAGEVDLLTFVGTAGDVVDLTLVHPGGLFTGGLRARATVFAPSGTQIDQFDSNTQQTLTLPESGTYVVRVNANGLTGVGAYTLGLECPGLEADLSITKVDDVDPIIAGNTLTYTVTVNNAGPSDAQNVVVTETLPAGVTFVSTAGCTEDPTGVPTCSLGTIASGGSAQYTITVTVDAATTGTLTNTATVASDTGDPDATNNTATEDTTVEILPVVTIAATDSEAAEAGSDPATFTVTRTGPTTNSLTVSYGIAGTATNGTDYQTITESVTIQAGSATADVIVTPIDDADDEGPESVVLTLTGDPAYTIGTPGQANATIADNDTVVTIAVSDPNAAEAGADPGEFTLTRTSVDLSTDLLVNLTVGGTATGGADYTSLGGATINVTIPATQTSTTITITPLPDNLADGDETVVLTINPLATYAVGTPDTATVTIADDPPVVNVTATDSNAAEAGPDPGTFTVTRTGGDPSADLTVNFSLTGTAMFGTDYANPGVSVIIPGNQSSATVTITPQVDNVAEGDETVILTIDPSAAYTIGVSGNDVVTIADNPVVVTITATDPNASESGLDPGEFTVTRIGGDLTSDLVVFVQRSGTATNGTDYASIGGSTFVVTIPANQTSATITITPVEDILVEGNETVILTLQANAAYTVGTPGTATVTIQDNDSSPPPPPQATELDLVVTTHPNIVEAGSRVLFDITVANVSSGSFDGVEMTMTVPAGLSFNRIVDAEPDTTFFCVNNNACTAGQEARWDLGTLAAGASRTITVNALVDGGLANGTVIRAPVRVTATGLTDTVSVEKTVTVQNSPSAQLALGASKDPVLPAETFTWTVDVGNVSGSALTGVDLRVALPSGVTVGTISDGGTQDAATGEIVWPLVSLAAGSTVHRDVAVTVASGTSAGTILMATAELRHDGGVAVDARAEKAVTVVTAFSLSLDYSATPNPVAAGNRLEYTITVSNLSGAAVNDVTVVYRVPAGLSFDRIVDAEPDTTFFCVNSNACTAGQEARWDLGTLAAGASRTITVNALVDAGLANGTVIRAPVRVTATGLTDTVSVEKTVTVQ